MWLAAPVYEALPPIYAIAGVGAFIYAPSVITAICGVLLIGAGFVIWKTRNQSRIKANKLRRNQGTKKLNVRL